MLYQNNKLKEEKRKNRKPNSLKAVEPTALVCVMDWRSARRNSGREAKGNYGVSYTTEEENASSYGGEEGH